jgi:putative lipoic acid-binding regulatory protein
MSDKTETVLIFPCRFPIKILGRDNPDFHDIALRVVETHAGEIKPHDIRTAPSRQGNFVSITITIDATSQQQLDDIYRDLSAHEQIMVAL